MIFLLLVFCFESIVFNQTIPQLRRIHFSYCKLTCISGDPAFIACMSPVWQAVSRWLIIISIIALADVWNMEPLFSVSFSAHKPVNNRAHWTTLPLGNKFLLPLHSSNSKLSKFMRCRTPALYHFPLSSSGRVIQRAVLLEHGSPACRAATLYHIANLPYKKVKCRRKSKGHCCCLGGKNYSTPCRASYFS